MAGSLYVVIRTLKEEREINEQGLVIEIASTYEMKDAGWDTGSICQVNGKSKASNSIYLRDISIRIFCVTILGCIHRQVAGAVAASCCWVVFMVGARSWKIRALVLDDFLKYIVEDSLWVIRVLHLLGYSKNVTALTDIVLYVLIVALVGELGHFDPTRKVIEELGAATWDRN